MKHNLPLIVLSVTMIVAALFIDMFMPISDSFIDAAAAAGTAKAEPTKTSETTTTSISQNPVLIFAMVLGGLAFLALAVSLYINRNKGNSTR
jgi:1,4-dihydroxy-2-naphthoate octaprenyltransferase